MVYQAKIIWDFYIGILIKALEGIDFLYFLSVVVYSKLLMCITEANFIPAKLQMLSKYLWKWHLRLWTWLNSFTVKFPQLKHMGVPLIYMLHCKYLFVLVLIWKYFIFYLMTTYCFKGFFFVCVFSSNFFLSYLIGRMSVALVYATTTMLVAMQTVSIIIMTSPKKILVTVLIPLLMELQKT